MDNIIIQMIILLLLVVAGFISNKCGLMGGDFDRKLSGFIINVSCPCLIISSVMGDVFPDRGMILPLIGVGVVTYVLLFVIAYFLPRYFVRKVDYRGMYSFMLMFGNVGFIGYPIVASIFGSQAVFYVQSVKHTKHTFHFHYRPVVCIGQYRRPSFQCPYTLLSGDGSFVHIYNNRCSWYRQNAESSV